MTARGALGGIKARLAGATPGPWFLNDCEGEIIVLPESDLTMVTRGEDGTITSWGLPTSWRPERRILEVDLDTWDEGEDEQDDHVRHNAEFIAAAPTDVARLVGAVEAVLAKLDEWDSFKAFPDAEESQRWYSLGKRHASASVRAAIENALKEGQ